MKKIYFQPLVLSDAVKIHYLFIVFCFKIKHRLNRIALLCYMPSSYSWMLSANVVNSLSAPRGRSLLLAHWIIPARVKIATATSNSPLMVRPNARSMSCLILRLLSLSCSEIPNNHFANIFQPLSSTLAPFRFVGSRITCCSGLSHLSG